MSKDTTHAYFSLINVLLVKYLLLKLRNHDITEINTHLIAGVQL